MFPGFGENNFPSPKDSLPVDRLLPEYRLCLNPFPLFIDFLFTEAAGKNAGEIFRRLTGISDFPTPPLSISDKDRDSFRQNRAFDPFGSLSQEIIPSDQRRRWGEFYTPEYLANALFQEAAGLLPGNGTEPVVSSTLTKISPPSDAVQEIPSILDPACGSGRFLILAIRHFYARGIPISAILSRIAGWDRNPFSVFTARAAIALELWRLGGLEAADKVLSGNPLPIFCRDLIQEASDSVPVQRRFDLIIGNPPWQTWDRLPEESRRGIEPLWRRYGLFSLSGKEARLGGGKKELAGLFLLAAADRCLKSNGLLASVIPMSLLKSGRSGEGFRSLRRGTDGELGLIRIGDYSAVRPFAPLSIQAGTIILQHGGTTKFPVPVRFWQKKEDGTFSVSNLWGECSEKGRLNSAVRYRNSAEAIGSAEADENIIQGDTETPMPVCDAEEPLPTARLGVNTAGANGLFWLIPADAEAMEGLQNGAAAVRMRNLPKMGKRDFPEQTAELETALLFPLLRWRDVGPGRAEPSVWLLMPHDPVQRRGIDAETLQSRYPLTAAYLASFEEPLRQRAAYRRWMSNGPYWSLFNLCTDSLSLYKVVWRRMDRQLTAAFVGPGTGGRPILPQETLSFIPVSTPAEGEYYEKLLNSETIRRRAAEVSLPGTKSFGSPGLFRLLGLKGFRS